MDQLQTDIFIELNFCNELHSKNTIGMSGWIPFKSHFNVESIAGISRCSTTFLEYWVCSFQWIAILRLIQMAVTSQTTFLNAFHWMTFLFPNKISLKYLPFYIVIFSPILPKECKLWCVLLILNPDLSFALVTSTPYAISYYAGLFCSALNCAT